VALEEISKLWRCYKLKKKQPINKLVRDFVALRAEFFGCPFNLALRSYREHRKLGAISWRQVKRGARQWKRYQFFEKKMKRFQQRRLSNP
jgi:hypothetical protein